MTLAIRPASVTRPSPQTSKLPPSTARVVVGKPVKTPRVVNNLSSKILFELPLKETLEKALRPNPEKVVVKGQKVGIDRLRTFAVHGCKCVRCGREGKRIIVTQDNGGGIHADLYTLSSKKNLILMNRDHILPKSKGGENSIWNYQPMCQPCNTKKGAQETAGDKKLLKFRKRWSKWFNLIRPFTRGHPLTYAVTKMIAVIT